MESQVRSYRAWQALVILSVLMVTACSSDQEASEENDGRRSQDPDSPSETTRPSASPTVDLLPVLTTTRFQTPSGKIHCESVPNGFACVVDYRLVKEPPRDLCHEYWVGLFIRPGEYAGPMCSGTDAGISREPARELRYDQTWVLGGITCLVVKSGLTCQDDVGNGFTVAMAGWSLLGKEAAASAALSALRPIVRRRATQDAAPGEVESVSRPVLRAGDGCGELQEAVVPVQLSMAGPATYTACYVTGQWIIRAGPLFDDHE